MRVVNKFLAYRAEQEHKLIHGVDGKKFELGDVNTVNLTMLNVSKVLTRIGSQFA
jgi:hypothetical protein